MNTNAKDVDLRSKDKDKFMKYFREAMDLFSSDFKLHNYDIIKEAELVYVLGSLLIVSDEPVGSESVRNLISKAIIDCKKNGISSPEQIIQTVNKIYFKIKNEPKKKYKVVASLHIDKSILPKSSGRFLGFTFKTYKPKTFLNKYKFSRYINPPLKNVEKTSAFLILNKNEKADLKNSNYFEVELEAQNAMQAFREGFNTIELFRSFLNYSYCFGDYRYLGSDRPYSIVLPPAYIFVFDENHNLLQDWQTSSLHERSNRGLDKNSIAKIKEGFTFVVKKIEKIRDDRIQDVLLNAFLRHGKGLDELAYGTAFICFWQSLELISLKHIFNFSEKDVSKRIKVLLPNEKLKDIVDALYRKRNYVVHEGQISDYELIDCNSGKQISELVLYYMLKHIKKLEDVNELDLFYKHVTENKKHIHKLEYVLKYIKKLR